MRPGPAMCTGFIDNVITFRARIGQSAINGVIASRIRIDPGAMNGVIASRARIDPGAINGAPTGNLSQENSSQGAHLCAPGRPRTRGPSITSSRPVRTSIRAP